MSLFQRLSSPSSRKSFLFLCIAYLIWAAAFNQYFTGHIKLQGDASSYYEHMEYYVVNMSRGEYPMWERTRQGGVPVQFFMRRIGEFNPLYWLMIIVVKLGLSFEFAYISFLFLYFFLGVYGFYLLVRLWLREDFWAFMAALLLLFSSLGTNIFMSYILFVVVPMIWFFVFLSYFIQTHKIFSFIGMTLCLMVLLTTYIPFYFLTILIVFLLNVIVFFPKKTILFLGKIGVFVKKEWIVVLLCALALGLSCIPGWMLYLEGRQGQDIVLPVRHSGSAVQDHTTNQLSVSSERIYEGGIIAPQLWYGLVRHLDQLSLGDFYVPFFLFILFFLGSMARFSKRSWMLTSMGSMLFLIGLVDATPVYSFFHKHIFFFKYFRNLQFFLWFAVLPLVIFVLVDALRSLKEILENNQFIVCIITGFIYLLLAVFLVLQEGILITTLLSFFLSGIFFFLFYRWKGEAHNPLLWVLLMFAIGIQSLGVFYHMIPEKENTRSFYRYGGNYRYLRFHFPPRDEVQQKKNEILTDNQELAYSPSGYMSTKGWNDLRQNMDQKVAGRIRLSPVVLYDQVKCMDDSLPLWDEMKQAFGRHANMAFISTSDPQNCQERFAAQAPAQAYYAVQEDPFVRLEKVGVNFVKFRGKFIRSQFFAYMDAYHKDWYVYINGKEAPLYRTNVAFKGLWVPQGEHEIIFRFGSTRQYILFYGLLFVFLGIFMWLSYQWKRDYA